MNQIHMETGQAFQTANTLEGTCLEMESLLDSLGRSLSWLDWEGPGSEEFDTEARLLLQRLRAQVQVGSLLSLRLQREVREWLAVDHFGAAQWQKSRYPVILAAAGGAGLIGSVLGATTSAQGAYTNEYGLLSWKERFKEERRLESEIKNAQERLASMRQEAEIQADIESLDAQIAALERQKADAQAEADLWYNKIIPDWPLAGDSDGVPWRVRADDFEDQIAQADAQLQALRAQRESLAAELSARQQAESQLAVLQAHQSALDGMIDSGVNLDGPSPKHTYFPGTDATNCTKYASGKRNVPCSGNAYQWNEQAAAGGFEVGSQPVKGSVLVIEPDTIHAKGSGQQSHPSLGHVAIVENVSDLGDGRYKIHISEGGWKGGYNERDVVIDASGGSANIKGVPVSFIYDKK